MYSCGAFAQERVPLKPICHAAATNLDTSQPSQTPHTILSRVAKLRLFGKHPAWLSLRLNRRIWQTIPADVRNSHLIRAYGAWLQSWVRLVETRQQYFGTFFFRNRPALELMRRLANEKAKGSTLRIAVLGCSIGATVTAIRRRSPT